MSKRRKFTPEFKAQRVLEILTGTKSQAEVCREYQLKPQVVGRWKKQLLDNLPQLFEGKGTNSTGEEERIAELERMVGRLTMELEVEKKAANILKSL
jgi:transposase-like protein